MRVVGGVEEAHGDVALRQPQRGEAATNSASAVGAPKATRRSAAASRLRIAASSWFSHEQRAHLGRAPRGVRRAPAERAARRRAPLPGAERPAGASRSSRSRIVGGLRLVAEAGQPGGQLSRCRRGRWTQVAVRQDGAQQQIVLAASASRAGPPPWSRPPWRLNILRISAASLGGSGCGIPHPPRHATLRAAPPALSGRPFRPRSAPRATE